MRLRIVDLGRLAASHRFVRRSAPAVLLAAFILVPFALYEHEAEQAVAGYIAAQRGAQRSPAAALVLAALLCADVLLPIPSSLVAAASGFLLGWPRGALVNWLGLNAGAVLGYAIGSTAGRAALRRFVGERGLARAAGAHRRWGDWSLIVSRAVPVLAEAAVVFAGAARMPRARFALLVGLSNAAVALVYASVGALALETQAFLPAFVGAVALPGLAMLLSREKKGA